MKSVRCSVFLLLMAGLIGFTGCQNTSSENADRKEQTNATPVKIVEVVAEPLNHSTTQPATVKPYYQAEIFAKTSGYVETVHVDIGDQVEKGDPLATLHVPEMVDKEAILLARIKKETALETQAEKAVELANASHAVAEANLEQARSQRRQVDANVKADQAEFDRTQDLVNRNSVAPRLLDVARKRLEASEAEQQAAQSAIQSKLASVNVALAQVASAEAELESARATTEITRKELEYLRNVKKKYATLWAPFSGVVTVRQLDPGDLVSGSIDSGRGDDRPLFVLTQLSKVRVQIAIPEAETALIDIGNNVDLRFPAFPETVFRDQKIERLSRMLDGNTRTMMVEVELINDDRKVLPGMYGEATIQLGQPNQANVVPATAVRFDEKGNSYVYALDESNKVTVVNVVTSWDNGTQIAIIGDIGPGSRLIDAHLKRFQDGDQVSVIE